jgi:outer membrane protein assembly factor BamE (lipoprotein component of BamABCDE complex)
MKTALAFAAAVAALAALPSCSTTPADASAREWQRAECNRVIDRDDREKCLKRVER